MIGLAAGLGAGLLGALLLGLVVVLLLPADGVRQARNDAGWEMREAAYQAPTTTAEPPANQGREGLTSL
jgi:hypothetical protein